MTIYNMAPQIKLLEPIRITLDTVIGALQYKPELGEIICFLDTPFKISGTVALPDRWITLPLTRNGVVDATFYAEVKNGRFTCNVEFDYMGDYIYSNEEANSRSPAGTFDVAPVFVRVIKKVVI